MVRNDRKCFRKEIWIYWFKSWESRLFFLIEDCEFEFRKFNEKLRLYI